MGGALDDAGYAVTVDGSGNSYTTGTFNQQADFNPGTGPADTSYLRTISATNLGGFVTKFDAQGNFVWTKGFLPVIPAVTPGWNSAVMPYGIAADASGNVYVTGKFLGKADFNPGTDTFNFTGADWVEEIFIVKLDSSGSFVWAKRIAGAASGPYGGGIGNAITIDASGYVCLTGQFYGKIDFNPVSGTDTFSAKGQNDVFVARYNADGSFVWATVMGGTNLDNGYAISTDQQKHLYITGEFSGTASFGTSSFAATGKDVFITKLDSAGSILWAKRIGGAGSDIGWGIAADTGGNVYLTGEFSKKADFNPGTNAADTFFLTPYFNSLSPTDAFICKLSTAGDFLWVKQMGGDYVDAGKAVSIDKTGNIYTTGEFSSTAYFDYASVFTLTAQGTGFGSLARDIYVTKHDAAGNFIWAGAVVSGGGSINTVKGMAIDARRNIYTAGSFTDSANCATGPDTLYIKTAGNADIFVHKLAPCSTSSTITDTACGSYSLNGETYTASGTYTQTRVTASSCDSVITLDLTINPLPDKTVTRAGDTLSSASSTGSFQWIDCDNGHAAIPGATSQSYTPATYGGSYAVAVLLGSGCSDTSDCILFDDRSNIDQPLQSALHVYPNPTSGKLMIVSSTPLDNARLRVLSITGAVLFESGDLRGNRFACDLSGYAPGVYIAEIRESNKKMIVRLIKE